MKFFLDDITGASFAYSYKKLRAGYAGNCLRIRRTNDNAETDIGFGADGYIDMAAVESFLPSLGTFVWAYAVRWYDQTGNGNDATQTLGTRQPMVAYRNSSNVFFVVRLNSATNVPQGLYFIGAQFMDVPSVYNQSSGFTTLYHYLSPTSTTERVTFNFSNGTEKFSHQQAYGGVANQLSTQHVNSAGTFNDTASTTISAYGDYAITDFLTAGPTAQNAYLQGTLMTGTTISRNVYSANVIGARNANTYFALGYMHTFIAYPTDKFSQVSTINPYFIGLRGGVWYLLANDVTTGSPALASPTITLTNNLDAKDLISPAPILGQPTLGVVYTLVADDITTGAPVLGSPDMFVDILPTQRAITHFTSNLGREWKIEIHDKNNVVPSFTSFEVTGDGYNLQYESPNDDLIESFKASKCSFEMIVNQSDTALQTLVEDVATGKDGDFFIIVKEDSGSGYDAYWWGYIRTDLMKEPDTFPSLVKWTSVDGLTRLKDIRFDDGSGGLLTGILTFSEIIARILELGELGSDIIQSRDYLRLANEWYDFAMGDLLQDGMTRSGVYADNFYTFDDEGNLVSQYCFDVLEQVLLGWNAQLILSDGYWYVYQVGTLRSNRRYESVIDSTGQFISQLDVATQRTIDQTNVIRIAGGQKEWDKPFERVERKYFHRFGTNILPAQYDFFGSSNAVTFPPSGQIIWVPGANEVRLKIVGQLEYRITQNGSTIGGLNHFLEWYIDCRLTGGGTTYYLRKNRFEADSTADWVTGFTPLWVEHSNVTFLTAGAQNHEVVNFEILTPPIPTSNLTGVYFNVDWGNTPFIMKDWGIVNNIAVNQNVQDWNVDPYAFTGDLVFQARTNYVKMEVDFDTGSAGENSRTFFRTSNADNGRVFEYPREITIGSRVYSGSVEPGNIKVWDGSSYEDDISGWNVNLIAGGSRFNELAVKEYMELYKDAHERQYFDIYGTIDAVDNLMYESKLHAFVGANFKANRDLWSGVWRSVATTAVTTSGGVVSLPPSGGTGVTQNVPNVPTLPTTNGVIAGLNQSNQLTTIASSIAKDSSISNIPTTPFWKSGVINSGDTFNVMSPSGQVQTFTAAADVKSGDTSISVSSTTAAFNITQDSSVVFNAQQQSQYITNITQSGTTTTSLTSLTPIGGGTISGSGSITESVHAGLVCAIISFSVSSVSSPSGFVNIPASSFQNAPYGGPFYTYFGKDFSVLDDGIKSLQVITDVYFANESGTLIDGSEFKAGTDVYAVMVYPE